MIGCVSLMKEIKEASLEFWINYNYICDHKIHVKERSKFFEGTQPWLDLEYCDILEEELNSFIQNA